MFKDFENMGIYDLRNYARSLGIHSPTTKKRNELILSINEIINGKQPSSKLTNKGRPPKHKASDENILDVVLPNNLFSVSSDINYSSFISSSLKINSVAILNDGGKSSETNILFNGIYKQYAEEFGIAYLKGYKTEYFKENTIVLKSLVEKYGIKDGDYLKGNCKFIADKNIMLATDIIKINDVQVKDEIIRDNFEDLIPSYPTKKLDLLGNTDFELINSLFPIAKGARSIINFNSEKQKVQNIKSFLDSLSKTNNLRTLLISIDDAPEDIGPIMFKCQDIEVCSLTLSQTREQFFEKVLTYILNCVNRLEFGQDVAIVFYNATKFVNAYAENLMITKNLLETSAKMQAQNKLKDIFNLSRTFENSSLSIILLDAPESLNESATTLVYLDENNNKNADIHINFKTSYSKCIENVLKDAELQNRQNMLNQLI